MDARAKQAQLESALKEKAELKVKLNDATREG